MVTPEPVGPPLDFVLVCPPVGLGDGRGVPASWSFPRSRSTGDSLRAAVRAGDAGGRRPALFNRLEQPAFALSPRGGTSSPAPRGWARAVR